VFGRDGKREAREQEALVADLYEQIGRLQMELEWTKKKLPSGVEEKRQCEVDPIVKTTNGEE